MVIIDRIETLIIPIFIAFSIVLFVWWYPINNDAYIRDGWFCERESPLWRGQRLCLKVDRIVHQERSKYQDLLVFDSSTYGRVFALDGVIQITERDEFSYQEMIVHLPMTLHDNPKNVLVVGGGDGGAVREILKHTSVERVVLCDIDAAVIRVAKKYIKNISFALEDSRVTIITGDGFAYLLEHLSEFDVIITDSSDPVGPAEVLFQEGYFRALYNGLRDGGVISTQGECMWLHANMISDVLKTMRTMFPVAEYAVTSIPTYPSGSIGFIIASKIKRDLSKPRPVDFHTRYYSPQIHKASFVLPKFLEYVQT